jgi:hypothetical protein
LMLAAMRVPSRAGVIVLAISASSQVGQNGMTSNRCWPLQGDAVASQTPYLTPSATSCARLERLPVRLALPRCETFRSSAVFRADMRFAPKPETSVAPMYELPKDVTPAEVGAMVLTTRSRRTNPPLDPVTYRQ